jgi:hypothetical protein
MKKIPFQLAGKIIVGILSSVILFHLFVLFGVIPYSIVWGGRLENSAQMIQFEMVSVSINVIAILVTMMKLKLIRPMISARAVNVILWIFMLLFALNTIGNLFSLNSLETIIFTPMTFVLALLMGRLLLVKGE